MRISKMCINMKNCRKQLIENVRQKFAEWQTRPGRNALFAVMACLLEAACTEIVPERAMAEVHDGFQNKGTVMFQAYCPEASPGMEGTKASETALEDVYVYLYYDGKLLKRLELGSGMESSTELTVGKNYTWYAVANIPDVGLEAAEEELKSKHINVTPGEPEENFPMTASGNFTMTGMNCTVNIHLERLYSKVRFSMDREILPEMKITSVCIKQASTSAALFSESAAMAVADGDAASESELEMLNSGGEIELFLPENCQGVLLPSNHDSWDKTPESIPEKAHLCSYMEVKGELNGSQHMFGDVTYRFYLGQDAVSDFNVIRNTDCKVKLKVSREALDTPAWQVETSDLYFNAPALILAARQLCFLWDTKTAKSKILNAFARYDKVIRRGGLIAVLGDDEILCTYNGIQWHRYSTLNIFHSGMAYGNGTYVTISEAGYSFYSKDGMDWERNLDYKLDYCAGMMEFWNGTFVAPAKSGFVYTSTDGIEWKRANGLPISLPVVTECGENGVLMINNVGNACIYMGGEMWMTGNCTFDEIKDELVYTDLVYGNGIYLLSTGHSIYRSENGFMWTLTNAPEDSKNFHIDYKDGVFMTAYQTQGRVTQWRLASSGDGMNWTKLVNGSTNELADICIL